MNRILYDKSELAHGRLLLVDHRATHILQVLKPGPGDVLRTGEINGPLSTGEILELGNQKILLKITDLETPDRPSLDLILALPRPKVLKRLLPQIAAFGVDRLFLVHADRVEKYYFDTHVISDSFMRERFVTGLMQSGDTGMPEVTIHRRFPDLFSRNEFPVNRFLLQPGATVSLLDLPVEEGKIVLAIGPEGGWRERELECFDRQGFLKASIGRRILKSDTACVTALGIAALLGEKHAGA